MWIVGDPSRFPCYLVPPPFVGQRSPKVFSLARVIIYDICLVHNYVL